MIGKNLEKEGSGRKFKIDILIDARTREDHTALTGRRWRKEEEKWETFMEVSI